jgi:hypothetical protein
MKPSRSACLVLAFALFPLAARGATSYQFSSKSTGAVPIEIAGDVVEEGSRSRVTIRKGDGFLLDDGDVILFPEGAGPIRVLKPASRTFYQVRPEELLEFTSGMVAAMRGIVAIEFGRAATKSRSFSSPPIEGRKTRGLELVSESEVRLKISGLAQKAKLRSVSRWITTDAVATMTNPFLRAQTLRTGMRELDDQITKELRLVRGFPLRQTRKVTTTIGKRSQTVETTTEIRGLKTDAVADERQFVVPPGFRQVEAPLARARKLIGR